MKRTWTLFVSAIILNAYAGLLLARSFSHELQVSFLDIGQGDSILIQTPSGLDVLIDGGPDRSVMRALPKQLGPFDRTIDVVIATHPDKDHIAGLVDVLMEYDVSYFLESGVEHDSSYVRALQAVVKEKEIGHILVRRGMRLHFGTTVYADIIFPDRNVSHVATNDGSVALRLVHGDVSFLMAGDLASKLEDYLVLLDGDALRSDVLKASHHGSKHSTSDLWLEAVDPRVVVVSAGKGNSYGHPAPEVIERIRTSGAKILSTMDEGTVVLVSDGKRVSQN